jgi:hypothetical protein
MIVQIKDILKKVVEEKLGAPRVLEEVRIKDAWGKANPSNIIENATPDKFVGGVLYLGVKNSTWAQQIHLLRGDIISRLNSALGEKLVKDIKVRAGFEKETKKEVKERPIQVCSTCGVEFFGEHTLCAICFRQNRSEREIRLIRLIEKNPKLTYETAKYHVPGINDVDFHRAQRDIIARKSDQEYRERRNSGRKKAK